MAARLEPALNLVDLRDIAARDLDLLLDEEVAVWKDALDWDFSRSADLIRRFASLRSLGGRALIVGDSLAGYGYFVLEEHKGLIGDVYVRQAYQTADYASAVLADLVGTLAEMRQIRRIECQLMITRPDPPPRYLHRFERNFMTVDLRSDLLPGKAGPGLLIQRWEEPFHEQAARVIAAAYQTHVDAHINDQYCSVAGARRFLYNIVQYPGCGSFARDASYAAFEPGSGCMSGLCLASVISRESGHITQICVSPQGQGKGIGYELLRRSLIALREMGCLRASLTVTASNAGAVELYERTGFRTIRRFPAFTWEGF
jgi:ribosomal protein S18 acetylase RimI-like enzyme